MHDEPLFISRSEAKGQFFIHTLEEMLEANQALLKGNSSSGDGTFASPFAPIAIASTRLEAEQIVDSYEKGIGAEEGER